MVRADECYAQLPLITAAQRAEIAEALELYAARRAPCPPGEIARMLGQLALLFPAAKMSDEEAGAQARLYSDLLADLPGHALRDGFRLAAQQHRFYPSVAEIRACAQAPAALFHWRVVKLKMLADKYDREGEGR